MGYPKRMLDENEDVVFDLHPHWKVLVWPVVIAVVTVFAAAFASAQAGNLDQAALARIVIAIAAALVIGFISIAPAVRWAMTHFVLTTKRVIMRNGVLSRIGRDIPLFRVNDVTFSHTMWERLFGAGTLTVESAGERGQVTLADIPHVEAVHRELYRLVEMHEDARRTPGSIPDEDDPPQEFGRDRDPRRGQR
ncbi:MAG: PH domain-containing protein [Mycobacteriales bacterium]